MSLFFSFLKIRTAHSRNTDISIGGESVFFGSRTADFETIAAHGTYRPTTLTGWTAPGKEESRN